MVATTIQPYWIPAKPANEAQRLEAVNEYNLLDTFPEAQLDDITSIASAITGAPISLITLIGKDRQWIKSVRGDVPVREMPRDLAFCAHAINNPGEAMIVPSMDEDLRFAEHPFVTGDLRVKFYAGVPLVNDGGYPLGTLCVIDNQPKQLSEEQIAALEVLAKQVMCQFELRRKIRQLKESKKLLEVAYDDIEQFARVVAHDLKSPCANVYLLSDLLMEGLDDHENFRLKDYAVQLNHSSAKMAEMIDGILRYAKASHLEHTQKTEISLDDLTTDLCDLTGVSREVVVLETPDVVVRTFYVPLQQILLNLIVNAIKHNDKARPEIRISCIEEPGCWQIRVADNGPGIDAELEQRAFDLFQTGWAAEEEAGEPRGHGIGLATVRKLVGKLGGQVFIEPAACDSGAAFVFTVAK